MITPIQRASTCDIITWNIQNSRLIGTMSPRQVAMLLGRLRGSELKDDRYH